MTAGEWSSPSWEDEYMTDGSPVPLAGRRFQLWDYSPSHKTLLLRSPHGPKNDGNIDVRFTGVKQVNVESVMTLTNIAAASTGLTKPKLSVYSLMDGARLCGSVVAERLDISSNRKSLFDALPDAGARTYEAIAHFEVDVHAALKSAIPAAGVHRFQNPDERDASDFEIVHAGSRAMVDLMWTSERPAEDQARDRAEAWANGLDSDTSLLIVVGGLQALEVSAPLERRLRQQMPDAKTEVVVWTPDSHVEFRNAVLRVLYMQPES